jgi:hypothetical protein
MFAPLSRVFARLSSLVSLVGIPPTYFTDVAPRVCI